MHAIRSFLGLLIGLLAFGFQADVSAQQIIRYDNTNFPSNDLRNMGAPSFDACAGMCLGDSNCRAFTFALDQQRCYLKTSAGVASPTPTAVSGIVSGDAHGDAYGGLPGGGAVPACRVADTAKCPGCSVSCSPGQKAQCTPGNPSLGDSCLVASSCECSGKPASLIPPPAAQAPQYTPPPVYAPAPPPGRGPSCSMASSAKCSGCQVACSAGQKAVCTPSNPSLGGGCFIEAKCECHGG